MPRTVIAIVLVSVASCRATPAPRTQDAATSAGPGAAWLAPLSFEPDTARWRVTIRGVRDTTDRPYSEKSVSQTPFIRGSSDVLIASAWPPPFTSIDSMVIAPEGLRPIREVLAYNGFTRRYQYAGNHVWGTVQHADSTPQVFDRVFPEQLFAFSEVELLVRAIPLRRGWSVVVPLFSESDEDVEHDTITVVAPTQATRGDAWVVRFADPAIISTYIVLAGAREIVSIDTEQRRTLAVIRYRSER